MGEPTDRREAIRRDAWQSYRDELAWRTSQQEAAEAQVELFWGFADSLLAAGERLAEKLRDIDDSPWTLQILEEWIDAKDLRP